MGERSKLDEIEDYNFAVKVLVYKDFTENDVVKLLKNRGLNSFRIDKLINEVKSEYNGIRIIECGPVVNFFSRIIDLFVIVTIILTLDWFAPEMVTTSTLGEWIAIVVVVLFYYIPLGYRYGLTLGRLITGSRIVDAYGNQPSISQLFARLLSRLIPNMKFKKRLFEKYSLMTFSVSKKKLQRLQALKPSA